MRTWYHAAKKQDLGVPKIRGLSASIVVKKARKILKMLEDNDDLKRELKAAVDILSKPCDLRPALSPSERTLSLENCLPSVRSL